MVMVDLFLFLPNQPHDSSKRQQQEQQQQQKDQQLEGGKMGTKVYGG
jgi:hypothetical protein